MNVNQDPLSDRIKELTGSNKSRFSDELKSKIEGNTSSTSPSITRSDRSDRSQQPPTPEAKTKKFKRNGRNGLKKWLIAGGLLLFLIGAATIILITMRQRVTKEPVAPTAPEEAPAAVVPECSLTFNVNQLTCGETPCQLDSDCSGDLICVDTADGGYCSMEIYQDACEAKPSVSSCCTAPTPTASPTPINTPTPTPEPLACGQTPCQLDSDCSDDLICTETSITNDDGERQWYCSEPDVEIVDACELVANPSIAYAACCEQVEPSPTPEPLSCGQTPCDPEAAPANSGCATGLECVVTNVGTNEAYCSEPDYIAACSEEDDSADIYSSCCTAPPEPEECGYTPCVTNDDCSGDLICVDTTEGGYCSMEIYQDACEANPSVSSCCTAPTPTASPTPINTPTPTPTDEPGATTTPTEIPTATPTGVITVETTTDCNDACSVNSDCDNISHICYNGRCRLDVNPENESCKLPSGETIVQRPPRQPEQLPEAGFSDWITYLKAGVGAVGAGLLLLLLL